MADNEAWRSRPRVRLLAVIVGAVTVQVRVTELDGVEKPGGVETARVVVPAAVGVRDIVAANEPPSILVGLSARVATAGDVD